MSQKDTQKWLPKTMAFKYSFVPMYGNFFSYATLLFKITTCQFNITGIASKVAKS